MAYTNKAQLEEARALFYSWRLMDAYNILRRFFARLPFQPQKEHAEYIGMFARILAELGKTRELQFHMSELERLYRSMKSPAITYQLAVVYRYIPEPRLKDVKRLLEEVVRDPQAKEYQTKATLMLANVYDYMDDDTATCRLLIDSIPEQKDRELRDLVDIWKAKLLRDEKKFALADARCLELLAKMTLPEDWYSIASTKVVLARSYIIQKRYEEAARIILELRATFAGKNFRSIEFQISDLDKDLRRTPGLGTLVFRPGEEWSLLKYSRRTLRIRGTSYSDRILVLLLRKQFVLSEGITRELFAKKHVPKKHDKILQAHIQTVRRQLKKLGLPPEAVKKEADGYRLIPLVEIQEA